MTNTSKTLLNDDLKKFSGPDFKNHVAGKSIYIYDIPVVEGMIYIKIFETKNREKKHLNPSFVKYFFSCGKGNDEMVKSEVLLEEQCSTSFFFSIKSCQVAFTHVFSESKKGLSKSRMLFLRDRSNNTWKCQKKSHAFSEFLSISFLPQS